MANALAVNPELMFEKFVEGFDAACVISMEAVETSPQRSGHAARGRHLLQEAELPRCCGDRPDVSAATPTDVIERFVPTTFRSPDNVTYFLTQGTVRPHAHGAHGQGSALQPGGRSRQEPVHDGRRAGPSS